jgi:hypothetical protein
MKGNMNSKVGKKDMYKGTRKVHKVQKNDMSKGAKK